MAADSKCAWRSLDALALTTNYLPAAVALSAVKSLRGSTTGSKLNVMIEAGARPASALARAVPPRSLKPDQWSQMVAYWEQSHRTFARTLLAQQGSDVAYLHEWADRIGDVDDSLIPISLRAVCLSGFSSPTLVDTPFVHVYTTPQTRPLARPPVQVTSYRPVSIEHSSSSNGIILLAAMKRARLWISRLAEDLSNMASNPLYVRRLRDPLIITQLEFYEEAKGVVWDTRRRHFNGPEDTVGFFMPLDFAAPMASHLNVSFLRSVLGEDYPDAELFSFLEHGVQFKADLPLALVLFPHLTSLPKGF